MSTKGVSYYTSLTLGIDISLCRYFTAATNFLQDLAWV